MRKLALVIGALVVGAQFIRVDHDTPVAGHALAVPADVDAVLRRACYDCHSDQTHWPWYGNVAPISWLLQRDVDKGRRRLNFSEWDAYASDPETALHKLEEIRAAVARGDMAPWYYRVLHPESRLTSEQRDLLMRWAGAASPPAVPPT